MLWFWLLVWHVTTPLYKGRNNWKKSICFHIFIREMKAKGKLLLKRGRELKKERERQKEGWERKEEGGRERGREKEKDREYEHIEYISQLIEPEIHRQKPLKVPVAARCKMTSCWGSCGPMREFRILGYMVNYDPPTLNLLQAQIT